MLNLCVDCGCGNFKHICFSSFVDVEIVKCRNCGNEYEKRLGW